MDTGPKISQQHSASPTPCSYCRKGRTSGSSVWRLLSPGLAHYSNLHGFVPGVQTLRYWGSRGFQQTETHSTLWAHCRHPGWKMDTGRRGWSWEETILFSPVGFLTGHVQSKFQFLVHCFPLLCVCLSVCQWTHTHRKARADQRRVFITLCPIPLRQGLSPNLELAWQWTSPREASLHPSTALW